MSIKQLVDDGLMSAADAERFKSPVKSRELGSSARRAGRDELSLAAGRPAAARSRNADAWLAEKAALPYFHIDPLKVDFTRVVEVMSSSYATRLDPAGRVTPTEVTIATGEPF